MQLTEKLQILELSPAFISWRKDHSAAFLAHLYTDGDKDCQLGYYDPTEERITTFIINGEEVTAVPSQEYLKTEQAIVELPNEEYIDSSEALLKAQQVLRDTYKQEISLKHFVLLQSISDSPTYNITFFTRTFKTLNVRIDAKTGTILIHSLSPLVDFAK